MAAYRIAMEAMTNAARHAHPREVTVDVAVDARGGALRLEIADDGVGLPEGYRAGVGITSMRERAAELGGRCTVERRTPRGTMVRADDAPGAGVSPSRSWSSTTTRCSAPGCARWSRSRSSWSSSARPRTAKRPSALCLREDPDVVLMDIRMPGGSGVDATRELVQTRPGTACSC